MDTYDKIQYDGFECVVIDQGDTWEFFDIKTGDKQGCNMSGFLFLIAMDRVIRRTVVSGANGIRVEIHI